MLDALDVLELAVAIWPKSYVEPPDLVHSRAPAGSGLKQP
jgi:hypothetical protein